MTRLDIAQSIESISLVTDQRVLVNQSIQIALNRVYEYFDWPYYMQQGVSQTIATYSTGTVTATTGSKTVIGSGTTFTSAMVGRKIRLGNEMAYYFIAAYVSTTEIILQNPYQGDGGFGLSYTIFKDEYRLAPDVDRSKLMRQIKNGIPLYSLSPKDFDTILPTPRSYANPNFEIQIGTKLDTYTTGTVSATGTTITGASTSWTSVEGLGRMSPIRIGSDVYTVKSVDSDTQITTYETVTTVAALTSYEILLRNIVTQFYSVPSTNDNIYYRYFRMADLLSNDYDTPDMPLAWQWLLIYGGLSIMFMHKGDINKSQEQCEIRFLEGLEKMKQKLGSFAADRTYRRQSQDRYMRRGDGLEKTSFDRRWSA